MSYKEEFVSTDAVISGKVITFVVPCYNSEPYMNHCIDSIIGAGRDIEIIIVDDGSTDGTGAKADTWAEKYPDIVRVIHQENTGHGGAIMAGLQAAKGRYFKVVDSDDWVNRTARDLLLARLRAFINSGTMADLVICNYVYEHVHSGTQKVMRFRGAIPMNQMVTWDQTGTFTVGQNILMHAAVYRTQVLLNARLTLPEHTNYVNNYFAYQPLPFVKSLYYLPVNFYRYFIGREDQSVNEQIMLGRLDQQMKITKMMVKEYSLPGDIESKHLADYMESFLALNVTVSSIFAVIRGDAEALKMRDELWADIRSHSPKLAKRLMRNPLVRSANVKTRVGRAAAMRTYKLARLLYRFN
ncbi:MAG: glycosyltransferase family A protein [Actinomycetaceae bacterium]|nr:glycosyltransferase family 2 protein [Arcanobacterium sp.]MDD7505077.1 glycosyltransferase family A protein [Actinomycetaceae bacterium]MDY6142594.1 glycosyltransferase family A protein [Arcanobacterium sp.]